MNAELSMLAVLTVLAILVLVAVVQLALLLRRQRTVLDFVRAHPRPASVLGRAISMFRQAR